MFLDLLGPFDMVVLKTLGQWRRQDSLMKREKLPKKNFNMSLLIVYGEGGENRIYPWRASEARRKRVREVG